MPVHGKDTSVLVNGFDLSRFFNNVDISGEVDAIETTTFQSGGKTYVAGQRDGKASLSGYWEANPLAPTPDKVDDVLNALIGEAAPPAVMTTSPLGAGSAGLSCSLWSALTSKYSVASPFNGVVSCMAEQTGDGGIYAGIFLASLASRSATASSAAQNGLAATTKGAVAHLHVTALAGTTPSVTVIVEDSADGATGWAQIGAFTLQNAVGAQRIEIAGTVRQYTRVTYTIAGSGGHSVTFAVALARLV